MTPPNDGGAAKKCRTFNPPMDGMWSVCADCMGRESEHRDDRPDLRDYFAAKALAGLIAHFTKGETADAAYQSAALAEDAYRIADAMLKARGAR